MHRKSNTIIFANQRNISNIKNKNKKTTFINEITFLVIKWAYCTKFIICDVLSYGEIECEI